MTISPPFCLVWSPVRAKYSMFRPISPINDQSTQAWVVWPANQALAPIPTRKAMAVTDSQVSRRETWKSSRSPAAIWPEEVGWDMKALFLVFL